MCERLLRDGHSVCAFDELNGFYDPQLKRKNLEALRAVNGAFEFIQGDLLASGAATYAEVSRTEELLGYRPKVKAPGLRGVICEAAGMMRARTP